MSNIVDSRGQVHLGVALVDPATGEAYVAGAGSGGGLADLLYTDDTGAVFIYRDTGSGAMAARTVPGNTAYTVGANPRPYTAPTASTAALQTAGNTSLANLDGDVGATADAAATSDTGTFSIISLIKRGLQNWTTLLARVPAQNVAGLLPVDTLGTPGTPRVQATGAAAASIALTATCRRVSMYATQGAWYSISGTANSSSHYIGQGERLDFDVPANTTISVLQETTAGSIRITELT